MRASELLAGERTGLFPKEKPEGQIEGEDFTVVLRWEIDELSKPGSRSVE